MYIDAYRMVWISAILIGALIIFGGPEDPNKGMKLKTKEEKWLDAIREKADTKKDPNNPMAISGVTGTTLPPAGIVDAAGRPNSGMSVSPQYTYQPSAVMPQQQGYYNQQPQTYGTPIGQGMPNFQYQQGAPAQQMPSGSTAPYQTNTYTPQAVPGYVPPSPTPSGAFGQPLPNQPGVYPQNNPNDVTYFPQVFPRWDSGPSGGAKETRSLFDETPRPARTEFFLRSGQRVFFSDGFVYVYDENGQPKPLPDGDYVERDNNRMIMVRGGKRIIN